MSKEKEGKGRWFLTTFPVILSLMALVFSGWSFYNSELKVHHELQVSITNGPELKPDPALGPVNFTLVFLNRGNQSEVILGAEIILAPTDEVDFKDQEHPLFGEHEVEEKYKQESFVIDAGGVKVWNLDGFQGLYRMEPDAYSFGVRISFLNSRGKKQTRQLLVGNITTAAYGELKQMGYQALTIDLFKGS